MVILTGDTHRDFERIFDFCEENGTTREDILVILGDAGINYYLDERDRALKQELSQLLVTLLCIHGNHEERPEEISTYRKHPWRGGTVFVEPEFPNLLFARDGEVYNFDGTKTIVIGGAYSIDKLYRLENREPWFPTEQPDEAVKRLVEARLERADWKMDCVLSHTVPEPYMPRHAFLPGFDQSTVDRSTEKWLDAIERRLSYKHWYAGHFHVDCQEGPIRIIQDDFVELNAWGGDR